MKKLILLLFAISLPMVSGQQKLIEFSEIQLDDDGHPLLDFEDNFPLENPTRFLDDTREHLVPVRLTPSGGPEGGVHFEVEPGDGPSRQCMLVWNMGGVRNLWQRGPVRVRYWMIPYATDKTGGDFGMKFHARPEDQTDSDIGSFLGTYFNRNGRIMVRGVSAEPMRYFAGEKYEFDWIVNFEEQTASLKLNGEQWIDEAVLPDFWLLPSFFAFLWAGQPGGGSSDAQWDFGGLIVEELE